MPESKDVKQDLAEDLETTEEEAEQIKGGMIVRSNTAGSKFMEF